MHLPEPAMRAGEFRTLGRRFGIRMDLTQWKVAEDESQLPSEVLAHGVDDRMREAALRQVVVVAFAQRDGALAGPRMWSRCVTGTLSTPMATLSFIWHSFQRVEDAVG